MLSRLVIAFLPRSKCLLISWLQLPSAMILEPPKIKSLTVCIVSLSTFHLLWIKIFLQQFFFLHSLTDAVEKLLVFTLFLLNLVTCLLRNLYAGQEATVRTGHGTTDWFQIGKGVRQGCILSPGLFNSAYMHSTS